MNDSSYSQKSCIINLDDYRNKVSHSPTVGIYDPDEMVMLPRRVLEELYYQLAQMLT